MSVLQKNYQIIATAFPPIGEKIKLFWGHQDFTDLMQDLLYNTRGHSRMGFTLDVAAALLELQDLHDRTFPKFKQVSLNARALSHRSTDS